MPGLVQRTQQAGEQVVGIETGGDADVARDTFGKGVLAFVQTSAIEGEADLLHDLHDQRTLLAGREFAAERRGRPALLDGDRLADEGGQPPRKSLEHRVDVGRGDAGAELVHERIIGRQIQSLPEQRRLVANQVQDLFQVRREEVELALLTGFEPADLGPRRGARETRNQRYGRGNGVIALAAHLAQVRHLPVLQTLGIGLRTIQQPRDSRRGEQGVVLGLERRQAARRAHPRCREASLRRRPSEGVTGHRGRRGVA